MCPECLQNVLWATPAVVGIRLKAQAAFCSSRVLEREDSFFTDCVEVIQQQ
ncbi:MAG: hypothetical protein P1V35_04105 [Planctomycetota bacterium]|nr:hypothetical protein [Planctomycetota bacterium]